MKKKLKAIITVRELADHAGVVRQTIHDAIRKKELTPLQEGTPILFTKEEAARWMKWREQISRNDWRRRPR